jgi:uncharacterized protein YdaU (DUF1376 family)
LKAPPWFKFFPQDFLVGTAFMSCSETGAYIRMLCYQWTHGSLPNDQEKVARLVGCEDHAVASIWHKFGSCEDGAIRNAKLESVRTEQEKKHRSQAINATKRWQNVRKECNGNATASNSHVNGTCQTDAYQISDIRVSPIVPKGDEKAPRNPIAIRINKFMGRRETTAWSEKEIKAFKKVSFNEEDLALVEAYYFSERKRTDNICRTSVQTLLNNWPGEVDRANAWSEKKKSHLNGNGDRKPRLV